MNIAVLFTGQLRITHDIYQNVTHCLAKLTGCNIDYFATTWYEDGLNLKEFSDKFNFKIFDVETYNQYTTQFIKDYEEFESFCESYKNDDYDYQLSSESGRVNKHYRSVPLVFYKIHRGVKLVQSYEKLNGIKYDLILRLRWDCELKTQLEIDHLSDIVTNNKLAVYYHNVDEYISKKHLFKEMDTPLNLRYHYYIDGWIDDTMSYSTPDIMYKLVDVYNEYLQIAKESNNWISHVIFREYIKKYNIPIQIPRVFIALRDRYIFNYYNLDLWLG